MRGRQYKVNSSEKQVIFGYEQTLETKISVIGMGSYEE
jgi:hypothetical protein